MATFVVTHAINNLPMQNLQQCTQTIQYAAQALLQFDALYESSDWRAEPKGRELTMQLATHKQCSE